jgi:hypothetical protein
MSLQNQPAVQVSIVPGLFCILYTTRIIYLRVQNSRSDMVVHHTVATYIKTPRSKVNVGTKFDVLIDVFLKIQAFWYIPDGLRRLNKDA